MILAQTFVRVLINDHTTLKRDSTKAKERNMTLDFMRGLAVIFMLLVHVSGSYSDHKTQESLFSIVIDFLGSPPAAPVFMLTMGIFFILSSKTNNLKKNILRGIKLYMLGVILSFLRGDLVYYVAGYLDNLNVFTNPDLVTLWEIDILQFAGLAYIFMSLIKHYIKKPLWWLVIALIILSISPLLWGIDSDNIMLKHIYNSLFSSAYLVYFPIFPWLYYPLIGMILGLMIKISDDTDALFNSLLKPGIAIIILGSIICLSDMDFHIGDYFRSGPGSVIWISGFLLIWIAMINRFLTNRSESKVADSKLFKLIHRWGKDTTPIYIVHWLLISWGTLVFGSENYGHLGTILLMLIYFVLTNFIAKFVKIKV